MLLLLFYLLHGFNSQSVSNCEPTVEVETDATYTVLWGNKWSWPNGLRFRVNSNGAAGLYFANSGTMIVNGEGQEDECYWIVLLAGDGAFQESELSYVCDDWSDRSIVDTDSDQRVFPSDIEDRGLFFY